MVVGPARASKQSFRTSGQRRLPFFLSCLPRAAGGVPRCSLPCPSLTAYAALLTHKMAVFQYSTHTGRCLMLQYCRDRLQRPSYHSHRLRMGPHCCLLPPMAERDFQALLLWQAEESGQVVERLDAVVDGGPLRGVEGHHAGQQQQVLVVHV